MEAEATAGGMIDRSPLDVGTSPEMHHRLRGFNHLNSLCLQSSFDRFQIKIAIREAPESGSCACDMDRSPAASGLSSRPSGSLRWIVVDALWISPWSKWTTERPLWCSAPTADNLAPTTSRHFSWFNNNNLVVDRPVLKTSQPTDRNRG